MSRLSACSERCGWCGRCSTTGAARARHAEFTRQDHQAIRRGLVAAGLSPNYFDFYDLEHLRKQGKGVNDVIDAAVEMETLAKRHERQRTHA